MNVSQLLVTAHISTLNSDEMAGDRPRQPAYEIFSTKRRFQQFKCRPSRFEEAGAGGRQRQLLPKKWLFYRYWLVCVKAVADRHKHPAIITRNSDKLFISVNVDDLE